VLATRKASVSVRTARSSIPTLSNGPTNLWSDDNGSVSEHTLNNGGQFDPYIEAHGTVHIVLRATNGTSAAQWDIFATSDGTSTCHMSVAESLGPLSPLA
jgi:hypothetical protein